MCSRCDFPLPFVRVCVRFVEWNELVLFAVVVGIITGVCSAHFLCVCVLLPCLFCTIIKLPYLYPSFLFFVCAFSFVFISVQEEEKASEKNVCPLHQRRKSRNVFRNTFRCSS
jgi:hypothetical protein